jgi:glycosyltransferase involved in cell wall biosynthesis
VITLHSGRIPEFLAAQETRRWFARVALGGYGRVIAVSEPIRLALLSAGVPPASLDVLPPFLPTEVRPGAPPIGFEAIRARRRPLLAMAHHPSPIYGREAMFRALGLLKTRYPEIGLAVFGPGTRTSEFRNAAAGAGISDCIEDFGELEHADALGLLARADVFVRPTRVDGDAISVREALALGTPCVASDACPRPWGTTPFRTDDAEDLARAIGHALLRGPVQVDAPDVGEKLLGLYQRLWSGSPRQAPAPVLGG